MGPITRFLDLRRRAGRRVRRELAERSEKTVKRPRAELRGALRRHGPDGERAESYLVDAARQLNRAGPKQGEVAAFALREASMALVNLGGPRLAGLKDRANKVITSWRLLREGGGSSEKLGEAITELQQGLDDPNETRLEEAIKSTTRRKPTRSDADLLARFLANLDRANRGVHDQIDIKDAAALYERSIEVIDSLFGPISDRFANLDALLTVREPSREDVASLLALVGDDRHLAYFFEKVDGSAWLQALSDESILCPPEEGGWPAGPYIFRLADTDPDVVGAWLAARADEELSAQQAGFLLRIALRLDGELAELVAKIAEGHYDSPEVEFQLENYLSGLSDQDLLDPNLARLVRSSLNALLLGERGAVDMHLASQILEVALRAVAVGDSKNWLQVLVHRLRDVAKPESDIALRALRPLPELRLDARARSALELVSAALRDAAHAAAEAGVAMPEVIDILGKLDQPLRARLIAWFIGDRDAANGQVARDFLVAQVASNPAPSPEELDLLRACLSHADETFEEGIRRALGPAPSAEFVKALPNDEPMPTDLRRPHRWLVAVPEGARGDWAVADRALDECFSPAPQDGVMFRVGPASFRAPTSPISRETLAALEPQAAAEAIGAWRPPAERSFLEPSAEGLADVLGELIAADSEHWLAADPLAVIEALDEPSYVAAYLDGLEKAVEHIEVAQAQGIVAAIAVVQARAEAEEAAAPGGGGWAYAAHRGVRLLGRLSEQDLLQGPAAEQAWSTVAAAVRHRGTESDFDGDLLTRAINRPWSAALEIALVLGSKDGEVDPRLLELLEECLALGPPAGLLGRAIIGSRLAWLRRVAPQWFADHERLIFGDQAPADLGEATFAVYLEWGNPSEALLTEQRQRLIDALGGPASEFARRHLLHGLIWGLEDFGPAEICEILADRGGESLSEAAKWLALALEESSEGLELALGLWRETLARDLPAETYAGWGWFALNEHVDEETWLELTLRTAERPDVNLAEPEEIAKRVEPLAVDGLALRLLARLLEADPKAWELEGIGAVGLRLLAQGIGSEQERRDLRERLLERGFHDAADIP